MTTCLLCPKPVPCAGPCQSPAPMAPVARPANRALAAGRRKLAQNAAKPQTARK